MHTSTGSGAQPGRTFGYCLAGAVFGHLGRVVDVIAPGPVAMLVFGLLAAAACVATARTLMRSTGAVPSDTGLVQLRHAPSKPSVLAGAFGQLARLVPKEPMSLGALSALLPCGALGAAYLAAVASANPVMGASVMFGFVSVSGLALMGAGALARVLAARSSHRVRQLAAGLLLVSALVLIARPVGAVVTFYRAPAGSVPAPRCH
jgi:sulfite exporter TauE/SafE